jgi:phage terminase large subunit-like protein
VRDWQADLIGGVFEDPRPRQALWALPRGNGKSTLAAALGLYGLYGDGVEGASVIVVAADERQARIVFSTAVRMVELEPKLAMRTQTFQDRLYVPGTGSTFAVLPAVPRNLEGLDPSLAIVDEIGVVDRRTYEVIAAASGKRPTSLTLCIGTPSPDGDESVMYDLVRHGRDHDDPTFRLVEYGAPDGCDLDDETAWEAANPALDDFLARDAMRALLPPKLREQTYRRARLGQWTDGADDPWLPPGAWDALATGETIPDGTEVVLGLDGSFSQDATALVAVTVAEHPHVDVVGLWEAPAGDAEYRVPVLDVEDAIRHACRRWRVREIVADPFRWTRTLQVLADDRLPVVEFPQSPARLTPATSGVYEAVVNRTVTHSGDARLARHVANAVLHVDTRGSRVQKEHKHSRHRVDLAVATIMAHSRAAVLAHRPVARLYV